MAGPALNGARKFVAEFGTKTATEVAEQTASHLATEAEAQAATGKAANAVGGKFKVKAEAVEETGEAVVGEGADAAEATRDVVPNNCFVAGTPVLMADDSFKVIEQVKENDWVKSRDPRTGKWGAKRVLRTFVNTAKVLLSLSLSNGERITTTPGHPFATSERGDFVLAGALPLQTPLMALGGQAALSSSRAFAGPRAIYNFEVEDWHTYFVGKSKLWVHNTSYVNGNPNATADEIRVGRSLDSHAQNGQIPGVRRIEGAAEIPGQRSGDYRFTLDNGSRVSGDLYQPNSGNPLSIASNIFEKSGQAEIVAVELGAGDSGQIGIEAAQQMAQSVVDTPGITINRVIVIKNGEIMVDVSRVLQ